MCLRAGQQNGEMRRPGERDGNQYSNEAVRHPDSSKPRATDYATKSELYGGGNSPSSIYDFADDVSATVPARAPDPTQTMAGLALASRT